MAETTTKPDAKPVSKPKEKKALSASPTTARLKAQYNEILRAELVKELGLKSISEAPKLTKIVVNIGLGKAKDDKKLLDIASILN